MRTCLALIWTIWLVSTDGFVVIPRGATSSCRPTHLAATEKTTLTDATDWNLRIVLRGVATEQGKKVDEIFRVKCNFLEEEGYEPPQGVIQQQVNPDSRLEITKSRWILSEDPDDRKDGLWVWGLFAEPLYPFMLLQLETNAIPLPNNSNNNDNDDHEEATPADAIKPLQLYAQINHKRDSEKGVILEASDLKVRQVETVAADVFGAAKVDVYEEVNIGTLSIQPVLPVGASN
eukprot:CAMPEP_0172445458 /NCGR_PEP_ID=MMETSP1065-20121228/5293_1 /TAXON_ID=265537 /ORGANISM="Amphiprora paludosa, Strain CCMP125" /LENGTH=232 /DNA_ID=CAMNT_0013196317 /DNA_START=59 /DNA_END=757 /DNA_ORIENTATION=-